MTITTYLRDLERRGILFGAGSLQDEIGKRFGAGMFIIRARLAPRPRPSPSRSR